ncbi:hypothetical protein B0O99DRAFT_631020 [Bisporella sp. PMI_857]|nr:hypothetical protein B0O99DRAFT_631020 [Bisporella sp. PMI_857]
MDDPYEFNMTIFDERNLSTAFHLQNEGSKGFRRIFQQTPDANNPHLTAKARIEDLIYGTLSDGSNATLLIIRFWFYKNRQKYRFKNVRLQFQFQDARLPGMNDPKVVGIYPEGIWYLYKQTQTKDVTTNKGAAVNIQPPLSESINASVSYNIESSERTDEEYSSLLTGMSKILKEFGDDEDTAEWVMEESHRPKKGNGVPSHLQVAVLLGLSSADPFSITLMVSCEPDMHTPMYTKLTGRKLIDDIDPVIVHNDKNQLGRDQRRAARLSDDQMKNLDEVPLKQFGKVDEDTSDPVAN